jgi:hypothetical protein
MRLIDIETAYLRWLVRYEKSPGDLKLAYRTRHAMLVGFFCRQRRTKNMGLFKAIRLLQRPPEKVWGLFPNPRKERLRELWRTVGTLLAWTYRAKCVDDLLADARRFTHALRAGIDAEIELEKKNREDRFRLPGRSWDMAGRAT